MLKDGDGIGKQEGSGLGSREGWDLKYINEGCDV